MRTKPNITRGFSLVEVFITLGVVVLLVGISVVGWKAFNKGSNTAETTTASTAKSVEVITTQADLDAAEKALGEIDFEDEQAVQAESQANL